MVILFCYGVHLYSAPFALVLINEILFFFKKKPSEVTRLVNKKVHLCITLNQF